MIRLLFSLLFWSAIGQWMCAEVTVLAPGAVPYLQSALTYIQIPTHNTWDMKGIEEFVARSLHQVSVVVDKGSVDPE